MGWVSSAIRCQPDESDDTRRQSGALDKMEASHENSDRAKQNKGGLKTAAM